MTGRTTEAPKVETLARLAELLSPITWGSQDTWLGKRDHRRGDVAVSVRLRMLDEPGHEHGPAFTARTRDISANGLGLVMPEKLPLYQLLQVEVFTHKAAWTGPMRLVHCTQTVGGYKVGLVCTGSDGRPLQPPPEPEVESEPDGSFLFSLERARKEVSRAFRRYRWAEATWSLLGRSMEKELKQILDSLPIPQSSMFKLEQRRRHYRHRVEGGVHLLVWTGRGCDLIETEISDISAGGAQLVLSPNPVGLHRPNVSPRWMLGQWAAVGIWTPAQSTMWFPCRIIHGGSRSGARVIGLQFVPASECRPLH